VRTAAGDLYPLCCEPVFNAHHAVARSALIGIGRGELVEAAMCVELSEAVADTPDRRVDLERELLDLASPFERTRPITRVVFTDRLPVDRRHNAKIDRPRLSAEFTADATAGNSTPPRGVAFGRELRRRFRR
jgi:acyl-coenzyme A synthetase/AMP-(fatty) acid ligase